MFKKMKIRTFSFLLASLCPCALVPFISGCSTEYNIATGHQESYYYSTDREVAIGQSMVKEFEKRYKLVDDPLIQKRVEDIGKKIAGVCDRQDVTYTFKAVEDDEVNAVSLPGGFVYVNKGLIDKVASDDELAAVLAHEVSHIVARHSIKKLQALMSYNLLMIISTQIPQGGEVGAAADAAFTELYLGFSREDELLADKLGTRYTKLAGYEPAGMLTFLKKLQEVHRRKPASPRSYYKTHPYVPDRMRVVKQELGKKIDFSDYINIEEKPHE
jgi:predicted Zn-dependent protease